MSSMSGSRPGMASRQGGGFRSGFGNFTDEHLEEQALSATAQNHQLTQQTTNAAQTTAGGSALKSGEESAQTPAEKHPKPREVGTFKEELVQRPVADLIQEVKGFFDLHALLNIHPGDTPEQQQKKEAVLKRFNELSEEQKQEAQKRFQLEQRKKKAEEEEKQAKAAREAQEKQNDIAPPSSPQKGPVGPSGSGKQKAMAKLQQDRKTLGGPQGAH